MTKEELKIVLERHAKWARGDEGGERADLRGAYLGGADLGGADLGGANLGGANLGGADLRDAKNVPFIPYACPDFGSFIGYKKCGS